MEIYIVQPGDTIYSIASMYGASADRLILDNGLSLPDELVIGQTIVIAYPLQEHIVQEGDTLASIADRYQVSVMQILRNNPQISYGESLYVGDSLIISYDTTGYLKTHGIAYPYIKRTTLTKVLPNLTYLSIFNYTAIEKGDIKTYFDDSEIITLAKRYHVIPLLMITSLTTRGKQNVDVAYDILTIDINLDYHIDQLLSVTKSKGYLGVHLILNYFLDIKENYFIFISKLSYRLKKEGYLLFITFNVKQENSNNLAAYEQVDFSVISNLSNGIMFLQLVWGTNRNPPSPVMNVNLTNAFLKRVTTTLSPDKLIRGTITISYAWNLPYIPAETRASALTMDSTMKLANDVGAVMQFDDFSMTPFFLYNQITFGLPSEHIVWTIDARTIDAQLSNMEETGVSSFGIWNVMIYYYQMWTMIHSQYEIIKFI